MMLIALNIIAGEQAGTTTKTILKTQQLLDYAAANDDAIVMYQASNMILVVHRNASYLSKSKTCSRMGRYSFLSMNTAFSSNNGAIHNTVQIISM